MNEERLNPKWLTENGFEVTYDNQPHQIEIVSDAKRTTYHEATR